MDQQGHVTIIVDDDVCLSILCEVAERCGGTARFVTAPRLELVLPDPVSPHTRFQPDGHARAMPEVMRVLAVRG